MPARDQAWLNELTTLRRLYIKYDDPENLWHERVLLAPLSLREWAIATPTWDVYIEDLLDNEAVAVCGQNARPPRVLAGESLFQFDRAEYVQR